MSEKISSKDKLKLKHFVKELEGYRGRHTELVSVYVPKDYDLNKIINHISQEQGTASNIKSKGTRDNVITSLEKMIQHLRLFKKTPPNGLAIFSGNVTEKEGQQDFKVWSIEPPTPLNQRLYRCDKEFVLDPIRDLLEVKEVYGMIVMDRREGDIALLKGKVIIPLVSKHSNVPGKFKTGGQSAQRFARIREGAAKEFYKRLAEYVKEQFLGLKDLKGILVGGPGPTKYDFVDGNFITDQVKQKIIAIKDLSYTGDFGLQELLDKCSDVLAEEDVMEEKKLMQKFFHLMAKSSGSVNYGQDHVMEDLKLGYVETVLISEAVSDEVIEEFEKEAEALGSEVVVISTDTREGAQLRDMGKVVAILRYEVQR